MNFVYSQSLLTPGLPDELFQEEGRAISRLGHRLSLIDSEQLSDRLTGINPSFDSGSKVVYRGWMLTPIEYANFVLSVVAAGGLPITSTEQYLATHYLPNWYNVIVDLTPETIVLPLDSDWIVELTKLGWSRFFVKDFVKSLKTSVGALIERPSDIQIVAAEMEKYRGTIEGGLCIRRVEDFLPDTENRYFVLNGKPFGAAPQAEIPNLVYECASRINSNFFTVDVILRTDGQLRVVEIGDGQVSDLVGWSAENFAAIWTTAD
jgi:hypothetical protein